MTCAVRRLMGHGVELSVTPSYCLVEGDRLGLLHQEGREQQEPLLSLECPRHRAMTRWVCGATCECEGLAWVLLFEYALGT